MPSTIGIEAVNVAHNQAARGYTPEDNCVAVLKRIASGLVQDAHARYSVSQFWAIHAKAGNARAMDALRTPRRWMTTGVRGSSIAVVDRCRWVRDRSVPRLIGGR